MEALARVVEADGACGRKITRISTRDETNMSLRASIPTSYQDIMALSDASNRPLLTLLRRSPKYRESDMSHRLMADLGS